MTPTLNSLRQRMRRQTERFLAKAMRSMRDPRAAYERLVQELYPSDMQSSRSARPLVTRTAA